jgi:predicted nucleotidyltransferase
VAEDYRDDMAQIPPRLFAPYVAVKQLQQHQRYVGAFIFGSVARGDSTDISDLDVKVVVDSDNACKNINHPFIDGVKFDITFMSMSQLHAATTNEIELRERVPIVAESLIVFDKTGELTALREEARQIRPHPFDHSRHQLLQFMVYHMNNKVERHLHSDPASALLSMHVNINELLHFHYQIQARWWISDKRLLADLSGWDPRLRQLLADFVMACDVQTKFIHWSAIIDHVLAPLGGRQPIAENNCACEQCVHDLGVLSQYGAME